MADIKEKQRAPIKILDKTKVGAERIKDNLVDIRTKNDLATNENGEEYAVNRIEENTKQLSKKGINKADEFGRKPLNETRQNISKVKDKIIDTHNRNTAKKTAETTKRISNEIKGTIKTKDNVMKTNKLIETNVRNAKRTADTTKKAIKTADKVAKESKRVAKESAKMAQRIAKATREAAIQTAKAVKTAIKVTIQAIKAIIAGTKALISAIAAGGWVAVVIVIIITIIGGGFIAVQNMNNNGGAGQGGSGTAPGQVYQSSWGTDMVFIAKTQLGNQGGQPYWSWYGFENRVEWCACFVSWVSNQCGYIDKGIIPKYSACVTAVDWFNEKHQYMPRDSGYIPKCGDIIFFDWKDKETGAQDERNEISNIYINCQIKASISVNSEMLKFYWLLGKEICEKSESFGGYGTNFYQKISKDLNDIFPNSHSFSETNLRYMRSFYELYSNIENLPQPGENLSNEISPQLGEKLELNIFLIPWGHNKLIIDKCRNNQEMALFYVQKVLENNWSRNVLLNFLDTNLYEREGKAITNFSRLLPDTQGELAQALTKDPYNFDFLAIREKYDEKELKDALMDNITNFLLELGNGFAFVGREVRLEIGNTEKFIDMLFYNIKMKCYVVLEVKVSKFDSSYAGQLGTYVVAVNH